MATACAFACLLACALTCAANAPRAPLLVRPRRDANLFTLHDWLIDLEEKTELPAAGCKFYAGRLLHEPKSTAALTACGNHYYGAVINAGDLYTLEPTREPRDAHVLTAVPRVYDLSGDMDMSDFSRESDEQKDQDGVLYFYDIEPISRPWPPRNTSKDNVQWLQLAVAADHSVVQFHGRARARHYVLALINIVSAIFSDASLGLQLRLALTDLKMDPRRLRRGPARDALASVNRWNRRLLKSTPPDRRHDAAVWLTRAALGGPAGFAPVGGVCSSARGAALARDDGLSSAFVVAHELAHLLGATHDTPACGMSGVMAPTVTATLHHFAWSTCTRNQLQKMLPQWSCLSDAPTSPDHVLPTRRQYRFTMNEQCRMEFGNGYELCRSDAAGGEPCGALWCAHTGSRDLCKTKKSTPLEGTPCGFNQWCMGGYCEIVSPRLAGDAAAAHPAQWTEWGVCQGGCGVGIRMRKRLCGDGSSECGVERATCAMTPCEADSRAARCRALAAARLSETDYWLPHEPDYEEDRCALYCVRWPSGEVLGPLEPAPEGTRCSYDNEHSVCFKGSCVRRPCAAADACGECGGGGRRCSEVALATAVRARAHWSRGAQLPAGARRLRAAVRPARRIRLALRDRARRLYRLLPAPNISGSTSADAVPAAGQLVVAGALLRWVLSGDTLLLSTEGPLLESMDLMVGASGTTEVAELMLGIDLNYTLHRNSTGGHGWRLVGSPCSASCGDGWRKIYPVCEDKRGRPVPAERCTPLPSPHSTTESCNQHSCDWEWWSGPWSHCSATCGGGGVQRRAVRCAPAALRVRTGLEPHGGSETQCGASKPHDERPCNRDPCPGEWVLLPWTPCSVSCGRGTQQQHVTCPATAACGARPPRVTRPCRSRCRICRGDASAYCALPDLRRYCVLPPFGRMCCRSCAAAG